MTWTAPRAEDQPAPNSVYGVICDSEALGRVVCNPRHLRPDGSVKPSCFGETDVRQRGLSLFRLDHMAQGFQNTQASAICQTTPGQKLAKVLKSRASLIRSLKTSQGVQAMVILDDPAPALASVPQNDAHAITVAQVYLDEAELLMIRTELQAVFT